MRFDAVNADAEDLRVQVTKGEDVIAKLAGFCGTRRRFIFRIKIENNPLFAVVFERVQLPGLVGEFEFGRLLTDGGLYDSCARRLANEVRDRAGRSVGENGEDNSAAQDSEND